MTTPAPTPVKASNAAATCAPEAGFSLTELLVVLVIIGILVALLALPRFMAVTTKARTTEAKIMLQQVYALQTAYYFEYNRYAPDLGRIGFEQGLLVTEGGTAHYRLSIEQAEDAHLVALATAVVDFDRDGVFNVWAIDQDGRVTERTAD